MIGNFWGYLETRPYIRARTALADCLWKLDQRDDAIRHYQDLLRLNPNDNQGVRHVLINHLLAVRELAAAAALIRDFEDDPTALMRYGAALHVFLSAPGDEADAALASAIKSNPHVPAYLLGHRRLPKNLPEFIGLGDRAEAEIYAAETRGLWNEVEGTLAWRNHGGA